MKPAGENRDAARRGIRLIASIAVLALGTACAIDVTEYTPFADDGTTALASDSQADPMTTGSIPAGSTGAIDNRRWIVVGPGDTLYGLARRHRTTVAGLAGQNRIRSPFVIRPGQRLALPAQSADTSISPAAAPAHAGSMPYSVPSPVKGGIRVTEGDTLYSIARRQRVDVADLMTANAIDDARRIRPGQVLLLPYQRPAPSSPALADAPVEHTGSLGARALPRHKVASVHSRRALTAQEVEYSQVISDYRVVPGQSILAPF